MKTIVIEVSGGIADCTNKPKGVEVVIVDHDCEKECDDYEPQLYASGLEIIGED